MQKPKDRKALYYGVTDRTSVTRLRSDGAKYPWFVWPKDQGGGPVRVTTFATFDEAITFATGLR